MRRSSQMRRKTMRSMVRWTAKLRSRCESAGLRSAFDVHRWLFRLEKKFARTADAKAIIRRLSRAADLDGVFMDDIFVRFGITADVFHVPAERFEHRIDKFLAKLRFIVLA